MSKATTNFRAHFDSLRSDFPSGTPYWNDESYKNFLLDQPVFEAMARYLPGNLCQKVFQGQEQIERLMSSYKDHGYGYFFYSLGKVLKPKSCVEIGVFQGFSLLNLASALRDNGQGNINGFDLFEDYRFRHEKQDLVSKRINERELDSWATVDYADVNDVHKSFNSVDYLHVDISNNGDVYRQIFKSWSSKVNKVILLEGGSPHRDQVEWMIKYKKPPISPVLKEIRNEYPDWKIFVLDPYPSLTIAISPNMSNI